MVTAAPVLLFDMSRLQSLVVYIATVTPNTIVAIFLQELQDHPLSSHSTYPTRLLYTFDRGLSFIQLVEAYYGTSSRNRGHGRAGKRSGAQAVTSRLHGTGNEPEKQPG